MNQSTVDKLAFLLFRMEYVLHQSEKEYSKFLAESREQLSEQERLKLETAENIRMNKRDKELEELSNSIKEAMLDWVKEHPKANPKELNKWMADAQDLFRAVIRANDKYEPTNE
ncbi:hypothetical protein [uncultured Bacteroides sp.]|uniref:hypothetical protein n=1 Tax=uncultured Bacteroides sp. TaxID=162156 RepID=UPI0026266EC8|nr:hypothetical protein [uncultured Bacteroides sp.]